MCFFLPFWGYGQIGGDYIYDFLSLPTSARITALGGSLITIRDDDLTLGYENPALLNASMAGRLAINHNFLFAGISNGYVAYAHHLQPWNITIHGGVKYIDYGDFDLADIFGNLDGQVGANEISIHLGAGKQMNKRLSFGANVKYIRSQLAGYNSSGLAIDIGGQYYIEESDFSLSFAAQNLGGEISSYREELGLPPLDIQLGVAKKLKYLPFRLSIIAHSLHRWDLRYDSPLDVEFDIFGNPIESSAFNMNLDNFFRHFIFSGEFLIGKNQNFKLRLGYNHQRRRELSVSTFRSLSGFSFGFGIKVKKIQFDYGVGYYHLAGAANHLSLQIDLGEMFKKTPIREE